MAKKLLVIMGFVLCLSVHAETKRKPAEQGTLWSAKAKIKKVELFDRKPIFWFVLEGTGKLDGKDISDLPLQRYALCADLSPEAKDEFRKAILAAHFAGREVGMSGHEKTSPDQKHKGFIESYYCVDHMTLE